MRGWPHGRLGDADSFGIGDEIESRAAHLSSPIEIRSRHSTASGRRGLPTKFKYQHPWYLLYYLYYLYRSTRGSRSSGDSQKIKLATVATAVATVA